jgi:hypothetical protein
VPSAFNRCGLSCAVAAADVTILGGTGGFVGVGMAGGIGAAGVVGVYFVGVASAWRRRRIFLGSKSGGIKIFSGKVLRWLGLRGCFDSDRSGPWFVGEWLGLGEWLRGGQGVARRW